jgi:SsrA-binding protein
VSKKKATQPGVISNRRARFDYEVRETYLAGLVLSGAEVKSLRTGHGHLRGAYVTMKDGELWLINATITPTNANAAHLGESAQTRTRKLLVKKKELDELTEAKQQGLTLIPLRLLTHSRYIKCEIAIAKGKKEYDKREVIKQRDQERGGFTS